MSIFVFLGSSHVKSLTAMYAYTYMYTVVINNNIINYNIIILYIINYNNYCVKSIIIYFN